MADNQPHPQPPGLLAARLRQLQNTSRDPDAPGFTGCLGIPGGRGDKCYVDLFNKDGAQPPGCKTEFDGNVRGASLESTFTVHAAECRWGLLHAEETAYLDESAYLRLTRGDDTGYEGEMAVDYPTLG